MIIAVVAFGFVVVAAVAAAVVVGGGGCFAQRHELQEPCVRLSARAPYNSCAINCTHAILPYLLPAF